MVDIHVIEEAPPRRSRSAQGQVRKVKRSLAVAVSVSFGVLVVSAQVALADVQSECAALGGNMQSGNVCRASVDTPAYVIDLRYDTDYPDSQPVIDYLTRTRDHVVSAAQRPGAQHLPYQMHTTYHSFRSGQSTRTTGSNEPPRGTQSLVLKTFLSIDNDFVGVRYKSFNFDFDQNRPVTFENLFVPGPNPIDSIYPAVAEDLARQQIYRHFKLAPDVGRDPATYRNFAISDDAVTFFLDSGQVMDAEAGFLFTTVPRSMLPPLQV